MVTSTKGFLNDIDVAQDFVFRVHVMAIAGRANGLVKLVSGIDDGMENLHQAILSQVAHVDKPRIVLRRLDFDVIVETHALT